MRDDRPSTTATLIAAATVFLSRDPQDAHLVPSGAAEWCARFLEATPPSMPKLLSRRGFGWAARVLERLTVPGLLAHFMLRKRWIETAACEGIAGGARQVAVIGAGFDTLCVRLASEYPQVEFVEIDHPATQRCKREVLGTAPANLRLIAADLAHERVPAFPDAVVVVEGLLMYLDKAATEILFTDLKRAQRIVFTVMQGPNFAQATWLVSRLLAHWREPFRSSLRLEEVAPFLAPFGFDASAHLALPQGELVVAADRR
jgi:methyltransferase (TIGR00027 family)